MRALKTLFAAAAAIFLFASCEKDERIRVAAELEYILPTDVTVILQKDDYTFNHSDLDDDDLFDIFEDITSSSSPDFDEAILRLKIFDEISDKYIRSETHRFVYDNHLRRYVLFGVE